MVIENFKQAYAIARNSRHHRLWAGEFIRFPGGQIYIGGMGILIIGRTDTGVGAGYFQTVDMKAHSKAYRRVRIENSRSVGPVPLP